MDTIQKKVMAINEITEIYDTILRDLLRAQADKIIAFLQALLDEKAADYHLKGHNSVYTVPHYAIKSRIKSKDSLKEKMFRKKEGMLFINAITTCPDEEKRYAMVKSDLPLKIGDLIGIKIITEVNEDCDNIYRLLSDSSIELEQHDVVFKDFNIQPKRMKNGLPIYNIKGVFAQKYNFELQIKSELFSAWGDMEHKMFYKDYSIKLDKSSVQASMKHIGLLLREVDNFLFELRKLNDKNDVMYENMILTERLDKMLSPLIEEKLQVNYNIVNIMAPLIFFYKDFKNLCGHDILLNSLDFNALSIASRRYDNYLKLRNREMDLILLETIYCNWLSKAEGIGIDHSSYNAILLRYFKKICIYLSSCIINRYGQDKKTVIMRFVRWVMKLLFSYGAGSNVFLGAETYAEAYRMSLKFDDFMQDIENSSAVKQYFIIDCFGGDTEKYFSQSLALIDINFREILYELDINRIVSKEMLDKFKWRLSCYGI